jgi:hypothetical protein
LTSSEASEACVTSSALARPDIKPFVAIITTRTVLFIFQSPFVYLTSRVVFFYTWLEWMNPNGQMKSNLPMPAFEEILGNRSSVLPEQQMRQWT